eukprot:TRINITY_DN10256_c0_g1_i2.p1 TRINITY_DN10256_c0_g1~~TRINITY_DN10256_c0_g1_i2.p1  ORF type:complete len:397 (+),score=44.88 TRINITY_DN10256_c0_g1_i2:1104-2294(+)
MGNLNPNRNFRSGLCVATPPNNQSLTVYAVQSGGQYRFRLINAAAGMPMIFSIDNHTMTVIEADHFYVETKPELQDVTELLVNIGQRYSVLVDMNQPAGNYWIRANLFPILKQTQSPAALPEGLAILSYDEIPGDPGDSAPVSPTKTAGVDESVFQPIGQIPIDPALHQKMDVVLNVAVRHAPLLFGFGEVDEAETFELPGKPVLEEAFVNPSAVEYGVQAHLVQNKTGGETDWTQLTILRKIARGTLVQLELYSGNNGKHPFHLHGQDFEVKYFGAVDSGKYDPAIHILNSNPPLRDTVMLNKNASVVLWFVAENPGVWFMHCVRQSVYFFCIDICLISHQHIDWHLELGLAMAFVVAPEEIPPPPSDFPICGALRDLLQYTSSESAGSSLRPFA